MWALQDVRLPTGAAADIVVDGDRIARLEAGAADGLAERIQCSGKLVLPGFIDGHVHLDKVLIRDELREHDGTLGDRKSTRLNSSHRCISYAVFCLKKK